ncbi:glycosyltransferase family 2 protein [Streptacidiphilus sp. NEAU-YB345]|uniref:Glycosyltransferase family 2 protein n=2 Tax=Streptacidiphilus fuscans TaxID=2789292 RepID=A0A931B436_9ACTN|nr:glycosyltransferase family 2 protein [Streptacidiphilus fuscans]
MPQPPPLAVPGPEAEPEAETPTATATATETETRSEATLSVVICCWTMDRWDDLRDAVGSVSPARQPGVRETVLVVDHNPALEERARAELTGADGFGDLHVVANAGPRGLSGGRNTGVELVHGDVVAFLDDDAAAQPGWAQALLAGYADPSVAGVGGAVHALWESGRPRWFPEEFDWVVGCSYRGLPEHPARVRNFIGANMSFRRSALLVAGGFRTDLGRVGSRPLGCEETELCLRLAAALPGSVLRTEPTAAVRHHVPPQRATWRYFRARCYAEGLSKAAVARFSGRGPALASERAYLRRTVPHGLLTALTGGRAGRAAALCLGVTTTVCGYAWGCTGGRPHLADRADEQGVREQGQTGGETA